MWSNGGGGKKDEGRGGGRENTFFEQQNFFSTPGAHAHFFARDNTAHDRNRATKRDARVAQAAAAGALRTRDKPMRGTVADARRGAATARRLTGEAGADARLSTDRFGSEGSAVVVAARWRAHWVVVVVGGRCGWWAESSSSAGCRVATAGLGELASWLAGFAGAEEARMAQNVFRPRRGGSETILR